MRQLTYVRKGVLEWWDVPPPQLNTAVSAIVQPLAVARCDLDAAIARGGYRTAGPFALGHEMTAVVVDVGDAVGRFQPGDRVIVPFQISCGACRNCLRGWTNSCLKEAPCAAYGLGTHPRDEYGGAFSDRVRVPYADHMLIPLPDTLTAVAAAGLGDNVADGYRTVAAGLAAYPGEPVLIAGGLAQSVGLYAVMAAVRLGSSRVVYVDFDQRRLEIAAALGAEVEALEAYAERDRHGDDFLLTVDASALPAGLAYAIRSTAPCGTCTGVSGGLTANTELPLSSAYLRGITYHVSRVHSRAVLPEVLALSLSGGLDPLAFAAPVLSFAQAADAMTDAAPKLIFSADPDAEAPGRPQTPP